MANLRAKALAKPAKEPVPAPDQGMEAGGKPPKEQVVMVLTELGKMYPEIQAEMDSAVAKLQGGAETPETGEEAPMQAGTETPTPTA